MRNTGTRRFKILAFPADDFGQQEPGTNKEIKRFCDTTSSLTSPRFGTISVKGPDQHPRYRRLTQDSPFPSEVQWNFQKYLVVSIRAGDCTLHRRTKSLLDDIARGIQTALAAQ